MRVFFAAFVCVVMMMGLSSCAFFLVGAGVAGGMAMSKDTAKLEIDRNSNQAWSASQNVIKKLGVLTSENKKGGTFEANVRDAKVIVTILQITPRSVRIEVKSRKNMLPQIDLSNEIVIKIQELLKSAWF